MLLVVFAIRMLHINNNHRSDLPLYQISSRTIANCLSLHIAYNNSFCCRGRKVFLYLSGDDLFPVDSHMVLLVSSMATQLRTSADRS
jgi:hypothetical protein